MEPTAPTERNDPDTASPPPRGRAVCWPAVAWGAAVGLVVLIAVATIRAVIDREVDDFDDFGWVLPLFVLLLVGYFLAGWVAQRRAAADGTADAPLTHGALGGLGAFLGWLPLRIGIWVVREDRGLLTGSDAALRPGQLFGAVVIAGSVGMLGGFLAARTSRREA